MNTKALLNKYNKHQVPIMKTTRGDAVIGTEVDENNQLHYVIKDNQGNIRIDKYNLHKISLDFDLSGRGEQVVHTAKTD